MDKFTFNRESLHYRLALHPWYGGKDGWPAYSYEREVNNSCSYIRHLVKGAFFVAVHTAWIFVLAFLVQSFVIWSIVCLTTWTWLEPNGPEMVGVVFFGIIGAATAVMLVMRGMCFFLDLAADRRSHHEPTVVTKLYRSWKDKYCIPIEYVNKKKEMTDVEVDAANRRDAEDDGGPFQ